MAIDLTLLATIVQTIVLTLTLLVFIFQFRSQEKAIRESSYQSVLGRYNDYIMSGSPADDLLMSRLTSPDKKPPPEELAVIRRLMIAYGILERPTSSTRKGGLTKRRGINGMLGSFQYQSIHNLIRFIDLLPACSTRIFRSMYLN